MQFYRCKCGRVKSWTTMGVPACVACPDCGSDLAQGPTTHGAVAPHEWVTRYDPESGAPHEECKGCLARRPSPPDQQAGSEARPGGDRPVIEEPSK